MIKKSTPITLSETSEIVSRADSENLRVKKTLEYLKKFKIKPDTKKQELVKKLQELGIIKLKDRDIVSITNLLPKTATELRNILFGGDVSLDENEIEKILGTVNQFK